MNIAGYTIGKATIAWVITVLVLVGGYLSYTKLGRFEDPEFVIRQAVVITNYPGASPDQVAREITDKIEGAIQQMKEVEEITSTSRAGESLVKVEIALAFSRTQQELDQVWSKLRARVTDVASQLPPGAQAPIVKDDFGDVYALFYAITGDGYSPKQLQDYADDLRRELLLVPGVASIALLGEQREAIYVEISHERAARLGVPLSQIYASLQSQNIVSAAGDVMAGSQRLQINPQSTVDSLQTLREMVVAGNGQSGLIRLKDVADIERSYLSPPRALMRYDGHPAIGLGVSNVQGGNVVDMGDAVQERLAQLDGRRPVGMQVHPISLQSDSVRVAVDGFVENLVMAVVIVFVVLLLFLGLRSGLIIGAVLVLTVAGTLMVMYADSIAMQRISLGALIIALGMLVDNAIVVTDGILVRIKRGEDPNVAAQAVVKATIWPLLGGTVVGILAFSAIGLSPTDMGEYAGSLFWVILYSMMLSWVFAVTLTPLFCVKFLNSKPRKRSRQSGSGRSESGRSGSGRSADGPSRAMQSYQRLLAWTLRHRATSGVALLALLIAGVLGFGFVPPGFMPDSARPQFVVDVYLPQGTDIEHTAKVVNAIGENVQKNPEVTHVTSLVGQGALRFMLTYSPEDPNPAYGQLLIDVADFKDIPGLVSRLQTELSRDFPQADIKVWKFMLGRGGGKKIEAAFRGPDPTVLRSLASQAKAIMAADPDAVAIQDDWRQPVPVVMPKYDADSVQRAGLLPADLSAALQRNYSGSTVGSFRENEKLIPIIARAPALERQGVEDLRNVQVFSPLAGQYVPIEQFLTGVDTVWTDAIIRRENRFPTIKAQADPPAGALASPLFERLRPQIEAIELPPGYELQWHGEYKASREANEGLANAAPYGFLAMVFAIIVMFNSFKQTAVIWLTVPLAIVGVTIGLLLFQAPFEFMAILGFLSLTGMLIKNAIVLVDQIDAEIRDGKRGYEAILDASASRVRPVALGALTTVLGVAPLLFDPFFKSMAVTIMFGLIFATGLTLVVVPLLYAVICRIPVSAQTSGPTPETRVSP